MDFVKILLRFERRRQQKMPVGLIRVKVKDINQLFNSMDPSPFEEQDLDSDAEAFIESWAFEYPSDAPFALEVVVDQDPPPDKGLDFISDAIHNFYEHKADIKGRELKQLLREGRTSLFVGLFFLGLCFFASEFLAGIKNETLGQFLREGMLIAGWVSMWKPIQIHLYEWWPLLRKARIYAKMSRMKITLKKNQKTT